MYHLYFGGETRGPYLMDQLQSMWASGVITADALYWSETGGAWKPVMELLSVNNPPPQAQGMSREAPGAVGPQSSAPASENPPEPADEVAGRSHANLDDALDEAPARAPAIPQGIKILPVVRDVAIVWALTAMGGFVVGMAGGAPARSMLANAASNLLFSTLGFIISGCLVGGRRWKHLGIVAFLAWLTGFANVLLRVGIGAGDVLLSLPFVFVCMGIGGGLSYLFRPADGLEHQVGSRSNPSFNPKHPTTKGKLLKILSAAASIILLAIGWGIGKYGADVLTDKASDFWAGHSLAAADWQTRTLHELSLEAPFSFRPGPEIALPQQARDMVSSSETFDSGSASNALRVQVSTIVSRPDIALNLDGAVNGGMRGAALTFGDTAPKYTVSPTRISNLEAIRASYIGRLKGKDMHIDALFVQRGHSFWSILAEYTAPSASSSADRVLNSVQIRSPETTPPANAPASDKPVNAAAGATPEAQSNEAFEVERAKVLADTVKVYPEMGDNKSLLYQTAERLTQEAADPNSPNHAKLYDLDAPRFFTELAAKTLGTSDATRPSARDATEQVDNTAVERLQPQSFTPEQHYRIAQDVYALVRDGSGSTLKLEAGEVIPISQIMGRGELDAEQVQELPEAKLYFVAPLILVPFAGGGPACLIFPAVNGAMVNSSDVNLEKPLWEKEMWYNKEFTREYQESQKALAARYPGGTDFDPFFKSYLNGIRRTNPSLLSVPDWPMQQAAKAADAFRTSHSRRAMRPSLKTEREK